MKRTKGPKKLVIARETLRVLSDDELQKANGGIVNTTLDWCSTDSQYKCKVEAGVCVNRR
jgi:hypothetical protein